MNKEQHLQALSNDAHVKEMEERVLSMQQTIRKAAHRLLEYDTDREVAVMLIGEKAVVTHKLEEGYDLSSEDREFLLALLKASEQQ